MPFCPNCGNIVAEEDVFCGNCGAKVKLNNVSQVTDEQRNYSKQNAKPSIFNNLAAILIKPVSTIQRIIDEIDQKSIVVLGLLLTIIQGLFLMWSVQQFFSMLGKRVTALLMQISSLSNMFGGNISDPASLLNEFKQFKSFINVPYSYIFFHGAFLFIIAAAVLFIGIYFVLNAMLKVNTGSLTLFKIINLSAIPFMGGELISIIISYISLPLGIIILILGMLISFAVMIFCIKDSVNLPADKIIYLVSTITIIMIVCINLAIKQFTISDINSIKNALIGSYTKMFQ